MPIIKKVVHTAAGTKKRLLASNFGLKKTSSLAYDYKIVIESFQHIIIVVFHSCSL